MGEKVNLRGVLFFHCTQEICTARYPWFLTALNLNRHDFQWQRTMLFRLRCLGRGAAGSGRTDDNEESLRKRFVTYEQATMPIIRWETIAVCLKFIFQSFFFAGILRSWTWFTSWMQQSLQTRFLQRLKRSSQLPPSERESSVEIVTEATGLAESSNADDYLLWTIE